MNNAVKTGEAQYKKLLQEYIQTQDEQALYAVEQISKSLMKNNTSPEDIVELHNRALTELYPDISEEFKHSMDFLLEAMITYGVALQEAQAVKEQQLEMKSEISVAANVQETLLKTTVPSIEGLDIGAKTVPAHQLNGDYHHFVKGQDGSLGIAIADVIGKGIPAALCMSMIKYSMDSYPETWMNPKTILENLNRVVAANIDPSMFITMMYAQYLPDENKLLYASAGHEPGYYYNAKEDKFEEIKAKGLVLGVQEDFEYNQYEMWINKGDIVILLTDGVTECRDGNRFIEISEVLDVIKQYADLPAQEMVEKSYQYFERIQGFQLRDDFTLVILKR